MSGSSTLYAQKGNFNGKNIDIATDLSITWLSASKLITEL